MNHLSTESLLILQMIVASILPTLVAFVTDSNAPKEVKTYTLIVLSAAGSALTELLAAGQYEWKQVGLSFFAILFAAIAAHKGVTSNIGLSGADSAPAKSGFKLAA